MTSLVYRCRMTVAGTPATRSAGGTSCYGDRLHSDVCPALVRLNWVTSGDQVDLVRDHDLVRDVDGSVSGEHALTTDEDGPADGDIQSIVRIEGRDGMERVTDGLADQLLEDFSNRFWLVPAVSAQLGGESGSPP